MRWLPLQAPEHLPMEQRTCCFLSSILFLDRSARVLNSDISWSLSDYWIWQRESRGYGVCFNPIASCVAAAASKGREGDKWKEDGLFVALT